MMFAAVIALKAYSIKRERGFVSSHAVRYRLLLAKPYRILNVVTWAFGAEGIVVGGVAIPTWYNLPCSEKIVMCLSMPVAEIGSVSMDIQYQEGSASIAAPLNEAGHETYPTS